MKLLQAVLIGIAIGILIAPDKGSVTRRKLTGKLSKFGDDAEDYLSETADNIQDRAEDVAGNIKSNVKKAARKIKSKADDLKDDTADI